MSNWEIHNNSFTDCNRGIAISGKHNTITQNTFVRVDMPISGGVRGAEFPFAYSSSARRFAATQDFARVTN